MNTSYEVNSATLYVHSAVFSVSNNILEGLMQYSQYVLFQGRCLKRLFQVASAEQTLSDRLSDQWAWEYSVTDVWLAYEIKTTSRVFSWFVSQSVRCALTKSRQDYLIGYKIKRAALSKLWLARILSKVWYAHRHRRILVCLKAAYERFIIRWGGKAAWLSKATVISSEFKVSWDWLDRGLSVNSRLAGELATAFVFYSSW